jgi:hypothetical protein
MLLCWLMFLKVRTHWGTAAGTAFAGYQVTLLLAAIEL